MPKGLWQEESSLAESRENPISRYAEETAERVNGSFGGPISYAIYPRTPGIPGRSHVLADQQASTARTALCQSYIYKYIDIYV
jgi:hypothetical protein